MCLFEYTIISAGYLKLLTKAHYPNVLIKCFEKYTLEKNKPFQIAIQFDSQAIIIISAELLWFFFTLIFIGEKQMYLVEHNDRKQS